MIHHTSKRVHLPLRLTFVFVDSKEEYPQQAQQNHFPFALDLNLLCSAALTSNKNTLCRPFIATFRYRYLKQMLSLPSCFSISAVLTGYMS
eukprot:m.56830 g.56830  ORF g.56830 m.56830 type:complete len:91 (-) comp13034_c1_seq1:1140-1412(-)